MSQSLRELNYLLQPLKTKLLVSRKDIWQIEQIKPLPKQWIQSPDCGTLYYTESENPLDKVAFLSGANLMIFTGSTGVSNVSRQDCPEINLLLAPKEEAESILTTLSCFDGAFSLFRELFYAVSRDTLSDGSMINRLSLIAGNPIALLEPTGKPIAAHGDLSVEADYFRIALSDKSVRSIGGLIETEGRRFLVAPVKLDDSYSVFLVMLEQNIVADESDMKLLNGFSEVARAQLQKTLTWGTTGSDGFLLRLTSGEFLSRRYIEKLSLIFGVSSLLESNSNFIAAFRISVKHKERHDKVEHIMRDLRDILHAALGAVKGDHIILLFIGKPQEPFSDAVGVALNDYLVENGIFAGISVGFSGMSNLSMYYDQAINAATLFERLTIENNYVLTKDYMFFDLLMATSGKRRLQDYISYKVRLLIDYDEKHGTKHVETLRQLFKNTCNIKQAAERMFIHRNTLLYRVKRMEEISGIDFSNDEEVFYAEMSLKVLDFLSRPLRKDDMWDKDFI